MSLRTAKRPPWRVTLEPEEQRNTDPPARRYFFGARAGHFWAGESMKTIERTDAEALSWPVDLRGIERAEAEMCSLSIDREQDRHRADPNQVRPPYDYRRLED